MNKTAFLWIFLCTAHCEATFDPDEKEGGPRETKYQGEAFIRVEEIGDKKLVVLVNKHRLVQLLFHPNGDLVDCEYTRHPKYGLENIVRESELAEDRLNSPPGVQYIESEFDISWYARYCRRTLRNRIRSAEETNENVSLIDIQNRVWLKKGVEETNFCKERGISVLPVEENLGKNLKMDECCMPLHNCESIQPLEFKLGVLNSDIFSVHECSCLKSLLDCLQKIDTQESSRLYNFHKNNSRCFYTEKRMICNEYNTWFTECRDGTFEDLAVLHMLKDIIED